MVNAAAADCGYTFDLSAFGKSGGRVKNNRMREDAKHGKLISDEAFSGSLLLVTAKTGTVTTCIVSHDK